MLIRTWEEHDYGGFDHDHDHDMLSLQSTTMITTPISPNGTTFRFGGTILALCRVQGVCGSPSTYER